jgi:branched-chain amino acid aminotransferase group I
MTLDPAALPDPRNASILVHVGGRLLPRAEAKVSVFDSVVQGGDACWEGLRVYDGRVFRLGAHLDRLFASAHALAFERLPSRDEVRSALFACLRANGMRDGVHVRLTLTRGEKVTSGMSPRWNRGPCTLIVLPEWKPPVFGGRGLTLVTSSWRRNPPQCLDSRIHHNNLLNNILAKVEADAAGADDAIMLDLAGFVAETNATNLFHVARGELHTPATGACLPGITRATVLELARRSGIAAHERGVTLMELMTADEVFTTGTMGELAHVVRIDGRAVGAGDGPGPVTRRLQGLFGELVAREGEAFPA